MKRTSSRIKAAVNAIVDRIWRTQRKTSYALHQLEPLEERQMLALSPRIWGGPQANEGSEYTLYFSPPNSGVVSWHIEWGDTQSIDVSGSVNHVSHTYNDGPKTYHISASATDSTGTYEADSSGLRLDVQGFGDETATNDFTGHITSNFTGTGKSVAIQPSDAGEMIVVAGMTTGLNVVPFVARYKPDGSPDAPDPEVEGSTGFGGSLDESDNGWVDLTELFDLTLPTTVYAVGVQPWEEQQQPWEGQHKIVVVGSQEDNGNVNFFAARLNPDGSKDTGFGSQGIVTTDFNDGNGTSFNDVAYSVAFQEWDHKIVVAGTTSSNSGDFAVARYNEDGTQPWTPTWDINGEDAATAVAVDNTQHAVIVGGSARTPATEYATYKSDFALLRFTDSGSWISTLSYGESDNQIRSLAVQTDGKVVAVGNSVNWSVESEGYTHYYRADFALLRYRTDNNNLILDSGTGGFGSGGMVIGNFAGEGGEAYAVAIQPDGKIVVAGYSGSNFGLARFKTTGVSDYPFSSLSSDLGGSEWAFGMAIQGDGKAVLAGYTTSIEGTRVKLARYHDNAPWNVSVKNVAPTGSVSVTADGSLFNVQFTSWSDPSSIDTYDPETEDGLRYSFATSHEPSALVQDYVHASEDPTADLSFNGAGPRTIYARIYDKDDGYTEYRVPSLSATNFSPNTVTLTYLALPGQQLELEMAGPGDFNYHAIASLTPSNPLASPTFIVPNLSANTHYSFRLKVIENGQVQYVTAFGSTSTTWLNGWSKPAAGPEITMSASRSGGFVTFTLGSASTGALNGVTTSNQTVYLASFGGASTLTLLASSIPADVQRAIVIESTRYSNLAAVPSSAAPTAPDAPTDLTVTSTLNASGQPQAYLVWKNNPNNETGYIVQRQNLSQEWDLSQSSPPWVNLAISSPFNTTTGADQSSFVDTTLTTADVSHVYQYRVLAKNNGGESLPSNVVLTWFAPLVSAIGINPSAGIAELPVTLSATVTPRPDIPGTLSYAWEVTDQSQYPVFAGATSTPTLTLTDVPAGNLTAKLTATLTVGGTGQILSTEVTSRTFSVQGSALQIAGPAFVAQGQSVTYIATGAQAINATWTVKQNTTTVAMGSGKQFTFMPKATGSYTIQASASSVDSESINLTVLPVAPTVAISGPAVGFAGKALTFTGHVEQAPGSQAAPDYSWRLLNADGAEHDTSTSTLSTFVVPGGLDTGSYQVELTVNAVVQKFGFTVLAAPASDDFDWGIVSMLPRRQDRHFYGNYAEAVAQQADGKILVAGGAYGFGWTPTEHPAFITRFNADLTLDSSFGPSHLGTTVLDFDPSNTGVSSIYGMAINPVNQNIVVVGAVSVGDGQDDNAKLVVAQYVSQDTVSPDGQMVLAGMLDPTFNDGQPFVFGQDSINTISAGFAVLVLPDGSLLVGGAVATPAVSSPAVKVDDFLLIKLTPEGELDPSFKGPGVTDPAGVAAMPRITRGSLEPAALPLSTADVVVDDWPGGWNNYQGIQTLKALDTDQDGNVDQILAGGSARRDGDTGFALVRYNANGTIDISFGDPEQYFDDGHVFTSSDEFSGLPNDDGHAWLRSMDVVGTEIVAVGIAKASTETVAHVAIARYSTSGVLSGAISPASLPVSHNRDWPIFGTGSSTHRREFAPASFRFQPDGTIVASVYSLDSGWDLLGINPSNGQIVPTSALGGNSRMDLPVIIPASTAPGKAAAYAGVGLLITNDEVVAIGELDQFECNCATVVTRYRTMPKPAASNLRAAASDGSVILTWTNSGYGHDGFEIWRADALDGTYVLKGSVGPNQNDFVDRPVDAPLLPERKAYYYKVVPFNTAGSYWDGVTNIANVYSFSVGTNYRLQESLQVPIGPTVDDARITSATVLQTGQKYLLVASGRIHVQGTVVNGVDSGFVADPAYWYSVTDPKSYGNTAVFQQTLTWLSRSLPTDPATATTALPHGYVPGDTVSIQGVPERQYNGTFIITEVPSPTTFKYAVPTDTPLLDMDPAGRVQKPSNYGIGINQATATPGTNLVPDWGMLDPVRHTYTYVITGEGNALTFQFHDAYYQDNSVQPGVDQALQVQIYATDATPPAQVLPVMQIASPTPDRLGLPPVISSNTPVSIISANPDGTATNWALWLVSWAANPLNEKWTLLASSNQSAGQLPNSPEAVATLNPSLYSDGRYVLRLTSYVSDPYDQPENNVQDSREVLLQTAAKAGSFTLPVTDGTFGTPLGPMAISRAYNSSRADQYGLLDFMSSGTAANDYRYGRPNSFYALLYNVSMQKFVGTGEPPLPNDTYSTDPTPEGYLRIYPIDSSGAERVWRSSYDAGTARVTNNELFLTPDGAVKYRMDHEAERGILFSNGWTLSLLDTQLHTTARADTYDPVDETPVLRAGDLVYLTVPNDGPHVFEFAPVALNRTERYQNSITGIEYLPRFNAVDGSGAMLVGFWDQIGQPRPWDSDRLIYDPADDEYIRAFYQLYNESQEGFNPARADFGGYYRLITKDGTSYTIDANTGLIKEVADSSGNKITYTYAGDAITATTGPEGSEQTLLTIQRATQADNSTRITSITVPNQNPILFSYDDNGYLTSVQNQAGDKTWYSYQHEHQADYQYRPDPVDPEEDPEEYDKSYLLTGVTNSSGNTVLQAQYDQATGQLQALVNAQGKAIPVSAMALGNSEVVETVADPLGNVTQTVYDMRFGTAVRKIQAVTEGSTTNYIVSVRKYDYVINDLNRMSALRDSGVRVLRSVEEYAPVEVAGPDDDGLRYTYQPAANSWIGRTIFNTSDDLFNTGVNPSDPSDDLGDPARGQIVSVSQLIDIGVDESLRTLRTTLYEGYKVVNPDLGTAKPQLVTVKIQKPSGSSPTGYDDYVQSMSFTEYNQNGQLVSAVTALAPDPANPGYFLAQGTKNYYDGYGLLYQTCDIATSIQLLPNGALSWASTSAASSKVTTYNTHYSAYDETPGAVFGGIRSSTNAAGEMTWYAYDAAGRTVLEYAYRQWTEFNGSTVSGWVGTTNVYNSLGLLVDTYQETYLDNDEGYGYILLKTKTGGHAGIAVDELPYEHATSIRTVHNQYDTNRRLTSSTDQYGGTTYYTYDGKGRLIRTQNPDGTETRTVYDELDRTIWTTDRFVPANPDPTSTANTAILTHTVYNLLGQIVATERYESGVIKITSARQGSLYVGHSDVYNEAQLPDPFSTTTTWYDEQGRVIETQDAAGLRSGTIYYPDGQARYTGPLNADPFTVPHGGRVQTVNGLRSRQFLLSDLDFHTTYDYNVNLLPPTGAMLTPGGTIEYGDENHGDLFTITLSSGATTASLTVRANYGLSSLCSEIAYAINNSANDLFKKFQAVSHGSSVQLTSADPALQFSVTVATTESDGTAANSQTFTASLTEMIRQDAITDANGHRTVTGYDALGRVVEVLYPDGSLEETLYSLGSQKVSRKGLTEPTSAEGWTWDIWSSSGSEVVKIAQHKSGDVLVENGEKLLAAYYLYDLAGQLTNVWLPAVEDADPSSPTYGQSVRPHWQYEYDAAGNLTAQIDPREEVAYQAWLAGPQTPPFDDFVRTEFRYDQNGNQISRTLPDGQTEDSTYDAFGRVQTHSDFKGQTTAYQYDDSSSAGGRLQIEYRFRSGDTAVLNGMIQTADAAERTEYYYDNLGRRQTVHDYVDHDMNASTPLVHRTTTYTYDPITGNITQVDSPEGTIHYAYDSATGRLVRTWTDANDTAYAYDLQGRLEKVHVLLLNGVRYATYANIDPNTHNPTFTGTPQTTTYGYDDVGNLDTVSLPNGVVEAYVYDALNRLDTLTVRNAAGKKLFEQDYELKSNGQRDYVIEKRYDGVSDDNSPFSTEKIEWSYDALSRLTAETRDAGNNGPSAGDYRHVFAYDLASNRVRQEIDEGNNGAIDATVVYTYNNNDQLLTETRTGTRPYTTVYGHYQDSTFFEGYDANGSLIEKHRTTTDPNPDSTNAPEDASYGWDLRNRMISATVTVNSQTTTTYYGYDHEDTRVSQTSDGYVCEYLYDKSNPTGYAKPVEERVEGTLDRSYILGLRVEGQADQVGSTDAEKLVYFLPDGHGSNRALLSTAGAVQASYDYQAFGEAIDFVEADARTTYLFGGDGFYDPKTAWTYHLARWREGFRFTSMDSWMGDKQDPLSLHKYLYASGNPSNASDPSGKSSFVDLLTGVAIGSWLASTMETGPGFSWLKGLPSMRQVLGGDMVAEVNAMVKEADAWTLAGIHAAYSQMQIDVVRYITHTSAVLVAMMEQLQLNFLLTVAGACFVAGTQVVVGTEEDGSYITRSIEDLRPGDLVLSRDQFNSNDDLDMRPVVQTFRKTSDHLRILQIQAPDGNIETIRTTDNHEFWVEGLGWVQAGNLRVGYQVDQPDGSNAKVISTSREEYPEGITVYNFEVQGDHTYFVEDGSGLQTAIWVHNTRACMNRAQARTAARALGYVPTKQYPFSAHGQLVFKKGNRYITPDVDGHIGGVWKVFDGNGNRLGTFDANLNWIGP